MQADFWHERWQSNQIAFHQQQINPFLQRFWPQLQIPPDSRVFVPLAGKSRDLAWLSEQGHKVIAIELSEIAVAAFFSEQQLTVQRQQQNALELWQSGSIDFYCGDFFALTADHLQDIAAVYDRASLIAMPPDLRPDYARHLQNILPATAPLLLITLEYDSQQMQGPPFPVLQQEVQVLYQDRYSIEVLLDFDALPEAPRFREKGLTWLREKIYRLTPHNH